LRPPRAIFFGDRCQPAARSATGYGLCRPVFRFIRWDYKTAHRGEIGRGPCMMSVKGQERLDFRIIIGAFVDVRQWRSFFQQQGAHLGHGRSTGCEMDGARLHGQDHLTNCSIAKEEEREKMISFFFFFFLKMMPLLRPPDDGRKRSFSPGGPLGPADGDREWGTPETERRIPIPTRVMEGKWLYNFLRSDSDRRIVGEKVIKSESRPPLRPQREAWPRAHGSALGLGFVGQACSVSLPRPHRPGPRSQHHLVDDAVAAIVPHSIWTEGAPDRYDARWAN